jgi:RHS repeat-associated protein
MEEQTGEIVEVEEEVFEDQMQTSPLNEYVWHPYYIDALAIRWYGGSTEYYYQHDANYNVTAIANTSGTVLERYAYTPYGEVTVLDADFALDANGLSDNENTHFYTGRERDAESGLQLNGYRFYAAHLGRWMSRDPIKYDRLSHNLYAYVGNSPVLFTDPSGLTALFWGVEIGASHYVGKGGGLYVQLKQKGEECCLPNGAPGIKTVWDGRIHGEIGIGLGVDIKILGVQKSLQFTVATASVDVGIECETPCGPVGAKLTCCRYCTDIAGNIPLLFPIRSLSIGFGIGFDVSFGASGGFRICYNFPGCPKPGLAAGFCGSVSAEWSLTKGLWRVGGEQTFWSECVALYGSADMLDW